MPQSHIIAKTAVFDDAGRLLVLRRSAHDTHRPGGLDLPGGRVDEREGIIAGALREAVEEAGLELNAEDMQLVFATSKVGFQTELKTDINFVWLGFVTKLTKVQEVKLSYEHDRYDWYTIDRVLSSKEVTNVTRFMQYLKSNEVAKELWGKAVQ